MILTSVKKKQVPKVDASRGLRLTEGTYSSAPLWKELSRTDSKILEVKIDCIDPSVAYVKTTRSWHRVYRRDHMEQIQLSSLQRFYQILVAPELRASRRTHNTEQAEARASKRGQEKAQSFGHRSDIAPQLERVDISPESSLADSPYPDIEFSVLSALREVS